MHPRFCLQLSLTAEDGQCGVSMEGGDSILVTSVIKKRRNSDEDKWCAGIYLGILPFIRDLRKRSALGRSAFHTVAVAYRIW